ncbi:uncharacterized protein LOC121739857 [Aricia agestis]|uniref:uncharacterized protein LOC121739857 n=1 Tax=Aricia agestis TaxID=91739 RepID=UPI001C206707|nr:uncharacterized protein LOC121739857 [Aricia agestis]
MIQQPMYQDLSENPEFQQQMMLCPVRVVYDTQMFLPPGEQVQQNQYVINPQNPPPWIQNQVQNQVIYVQNVPNSYMQAFQPQIDQNQFQTYGYNMPQMLVQTPQDPRSIQMIPANLMPNMTMNQRVVTQNITMPNQVIMPEVQNQTVQMEKPIQNNQVTNNNQINKPHEVSAQFNQHISTYQADPKQNNVTIQQSQPVLSNIQQRLPQLDSNNIQIRQVHPQAINTNVQQNYQTIVAQKANVQQNYQTVMAQKAPAQQNFQIITQRSPTNTQQNYQNFVPQRFPTNAQPNIQSIVAQKVPPINKTNYQVVSGTGQPIYRAIQPRPNQINTNTQTVQQLPPQNIVYMNNIRRSNMSTNTVNVPSANTNYVKIDNTRKRKSESPDEIRNKVVISNQNNIIIKQEPPPRPAIEIISNPTGAPRPENKMVVNSLQITALDTQNVKIKEELAKPVRNISLIEPKQMIRNKMINNVEAIQNLSNTNVQDKLIRNTVYTQARGRLITETEQPEPEILKSLLQPSVTQSETTVTQSDSKPNTSSAQNDNVNEKLSEEKTEVSNKDSEVKKDVQDAKEVKTECLTNKETKDEKSFLLTHVLDGYVIQESNMAFPIRRPLKEKTMRVSTDAIKPKTEPEPEFEPKEKKGESERLLDMSQLQLKEEKFVEPIIEEPLNDKENPFASVSPDNVKAWSVDKLVDHLKPFGWEETTLLLQDHEIDGESLFLVSKTQLTKIGISEEHATIICDFVKKS